MTHARLLLAASLLLLPVACAPSATAETAAAEGGEGLPDRDPALAQQLIDEGAIVIDTRSQAEYDRGHVDGAILIPYDQMESRLDEVVAANGGDKHKPIVVYCRSGRRSGIAKETLVEHGFDQVTNVGGVKQLCKSC